jgi:hypothetical protein
MIALMFALLLENQTQWLFRTVPTSVPITALACPSGRKVHFKWPRCSPPNCRREVPVMLVWCPGPK